MPAVDAVDGVGRFTAVVNRVEVSLGAVDADVCLVELDYDVVITVWADYGFGYFRFGHPISQRVGKLREKACFSVALRMFVQQFAAPARITL
jgi:hypothetical protein